MKVWEYKDYEEYKEAQIEANLEKQDFVWVTNFSVDQVFKRSPIAARILCHGTRNGAEQEIFSRRYRHADIIGSEISPEAKKYKRTVQWDFNQVKEDWVGKFDIIYTNSVDHTTTPVETISVWLDQLAPNGTLYIDHGNKTNQTTTPITNRATRWDPLEIMDNEMQDVIDRAGGRIVETCEGKGCFRKKEEIMKDVFYRGELTRIYCIKKKL